MTEYLIYFNAEWVTETDEAGWQRRSHDVRALIKEMKAAGVYVFAGGLEPDGPVFQATPGDGAPLITDGPFTETKEVIGGFTVVDVGDEASAREWAGRVAVACDWPQEVRLFQPGPED